MYAALSYSLLVLDPGELISTCCVTFCSPLFPVLVAAKPASRSFITSIYLRFQQLSTLRIDVKSTRVFK